MTIKSARNKGVAAERELAKILGDRLGITLTRNLEQTRAGGFDLLGLDGYALEVKRCENVQISQWWSQAVRQAGSDLIPVLAYRQSRKPWSIVVSLAWLTGKDFPPTAIATITLDSFISLIKRT